MLRPGWATDVVHLLVNQLLGTALTVGAVVALYVPLRLCTPPAARAAVGGQALWLQVVEVIVVAEISGYWAHRAAHRVPLLWRFHRVHHSSVRMDWLAAARLHPVDQALTRAVAVAPVAAAGFARLSIGALAAVLVLLAVGVHANVRLRLPVLRWVITTPEFHHWHHANQPEAIDHNFAGALPLLDVVFGTAHMPSRRAPERYGIDQPIGETWAEHMASPFHRARTA